MFFQQFHSILCMPASYLSYVHSIYTLLIIIYLILLGRFFLFSIKFRENE